jgi:hypothetical protein
MQNFSDIPHSIFKGDIDMMQLEELIKNKEITYSIDWDMTPEEAVTLYLEWGNNWAHGKNLIRSKKDVSYYFVANSWDDPASIYLIKRNSEAAQEIARIHLPQKLNNHFQETIGHNKGVYAIDDTIKDWLKEQLYQQKTN